VTHLTVTAEEYRRLDRATWSEDRFLREVVALARACGWLCYHPRPARTARGWVTATQGDTGFPDLCLCHEGRGLLLFVELKAAKGRVTPGQERWLAALRAAGVRAEVWRPGDWPAIEELLRGDR
jgi:hypothetical protein